MPCPDDQTLLAEVRRECAGEPLQYARHLADCTECRRRFAMFQELTQASLQYDDAAKGACLPPETLAALSEGKLQSAERQQAITHIAQCADCRAAVTSTVSMQRSATPQSARPAAFDFGRWLSPALGVCVGAAACFALMTMFPSALHLTTSASEQGVRGVTTEDAASALRAVNPTGREDLTFAREVWHSALDEMNHALQDNPRDEDARRWRQVLQQGITEMDRRAGAAKEQMR